MALTQQGEVTARSGESARGCSLQPRTPNLAWQTERYVYIFLITEVIFHPCGELGKSREVKGT